MKTRYYWDKKMECLVEIRDGMNSEGPQKLLAPEGVIRDIEPYLAVGIQDPKQPPGHALVITGGRRQHRDELRARGMTEVGNETSGWGSPKSTPVRETEVREALAKSGYYDGASSIRELRRKQFR